MILDGMPDSTDLLPIEFFVNPKCPLTPTVTKVETADVDLIKPTKDSEENASVGDQG